MTRLYPLFILLFVLLILGTIFYITYSIIQDVKRNTRSKMEKKNVTFSRDGVTVGVKELKDEDYLDRSQSILVNMWNHTSFPAYKSRLWDMTKPTNWNENAAGASDEGLRGRFWSAAGRVGEWAGYHDQGQEGEKKKGQ
ncbi:hypothetical protein AAWM_08045 [Aspergillus awamori]|uniref:Contig An16c0130, genomic contig n=7 Tax=Aspergillus TaxID=5052 RepID=A2R7J1_ASPNC|nr:uncharacterized protein An16g03710 [Aspergillus niger]XP_025459633.1 uncharacterized protein BO96DRAFT_419189 [Aspergillus niger CBS 101883]XP_026627546.1 hypothetical protein BDQ94DRAFT_20415 [Aspergillus welwitschiae]RDH15632.1 hypothetical protein M747DRAFT_335093 [Aspergillus niger ATCC 13496]RDK44604.1 hypothetical protein M752DRAFT_264489 [Aspergillus phoenicis ATCC 13157]GCB25160.1 hypothetical protein AAWM_08045 [Aspergillus awamori]KAI2812248.1 hypothetical protein CBS115989_10652|eukprot:XP_001397683.1 hypothetical protein ANI_1_1668144 [Aspergillus niger CBS 513.88]